MAHIPQPEPPSARAAALDKSRQPKYQFVMRPVDRSTSEGHPWNDPRNGLHNWCRFRADPSFGPAPGRTYPRLTGRIDVFSVHTLAETGSAHFEQRLPRLPNRQLQRRGNSLALISRSQHVAQMVWHHRLSGEVARSGAEIRAILRPPRRTFRRVGPIQIAIWIESDLFVCRVFRRTGLKPLG